MFKRLKSVVSLYPGHCAGGIAPMLALAAIPLIAIAGLAVDYARGQRTATEVQEIADGAVLAGASAQDITGSEAQKASKRKSHITKYLDRTMPSVSDVEALQVAEVVVGPDTAKVVLHGKVKGSLVKVLAFKDRETDASDMDLTVSATAKFGADSYSCLHSLNATANKAIDFNGNATLMGSNCRVQSNSNNAVAISLQGASALSASEICANGGASGSRFTPVPTYCPPKLDPYASLTMPTAATPCSASSTNVTIKNTTTNLTPGTYCGGIALQTGGTANLAPGLYIISNGVLSTASGSTFNAPSGVTIYLTGAGSKIDIASGSTVTIKAPTSATADASTMPYRSIAIMQDRTTGVGNVNQITSKGEVNITGVFYTPAQSLALAANGAMNSDSKYFPIIVDTLSASGTGELHINFDYNGAGFDNPLPLMTKGKVTLVK